MNMVHEVSSPPQYIWGWSSTPTEGNGAVCRFALSESVPDASDRPSTRRVEPGRHCDDVSAQKHRSWMLLQESLVLFRESSFLRKISPIFVRERVLMYCDFQYMSQLANLGLYVPKGYVRVPSYHKDWRTHIFTIKT